MERRMEWFEEQGERMLTRIGRTTFSIQMAMLLCSSPSSISWIVRLLRLCTGMRNGVWCFVVSPLHESPSVMQHGLA